MESSLNSRNIAVNKNEIFIVDSHFNHIYVYSYEGDLIRHWGNLRYPKGIAIHKDIIFITDSGNHRIQAFTCGGKCVFEYVFKEEEIIKEIVLDNKYAYVSDRNNILKLELVY